MKIALQSLGRNTPLNNGKGETTLETDEKCAQQRKNSRDCGVIVCHLIAKILKRHDERLEVTNPDTRIYGEATTSNFRRLMIAAFVDPKTLLVKGGRKPRVASKST